MKLEIKKVKACKNKAFGNFLLRGHDSGLITISLKLNNTLAEYGATLLHEMLHAYTTLMRREGFRVSNRKEHKWIEASEDAVLEAMIKHLGKGK